MAASKELLTEILDGVTVVQQYLQTLGQEKLSPSNEKQRQATLKTVESIVKKIQHSHPSIRPRVNTPGTMKKPPAPPPPADPPSIPEAMAEEEEGELYEEPATAAPEAEAEDYLSFEPASRPEDGEEGQEMYEAMEVQEEQDVYEEPVTTLPAGSQEDSEQGSEVNYEDPVLSRPSTASLPSQSRENSGSGAEYAEAIMRRAKAGDNAFDVSLDWGNVYTMPSKGEKLKPSALKNVLIKGYLEKLGGRNHKTWQRRYCVLSGALMYFYEKESSKTYNNCIALLAFTASPAENLTNAKKSQFAFKMTHLDQNTGRNKDYYFRSASEDVREKWLTQINKVLAGSQSPSLKKSQSAACTLPRSMPSQQVTSSTFLAEPARKRASSLQEEGEGELYEDMAIPEEDEDQDEYVAVSPTAEGGELENSEEYVDVVPQDQIEQEEYEDTSNFQQPPPPLSPPPGPPSEFFSPPPVISPQPVLPPKAPAPQPPPPEPQVDTTREYIQHGANGISLEKVFVSLWDFAASEEDELGLSRGDLVYVNSPKDTAEWWFGELLDSEASRKIGKVGFFPRNYSTTAFTPA